MSAPRWEPLLKEHPFDHRTLAETLIGGQAFRWFHEPQKDCWLGVWEDNVVRLRLQASGALQVQRLTSTPLEAIRTYLGVENLPGLITTLPCNADPVLARLRDRWGGLSILRQSPSEALLAFICSSNKQILQIRTMLDNLSARFGTTIPGTSFKTLPDWNALAAAKEQNLRACALGYRAAHIAKTAAYLKGSPGFLERIKGLSLAEARTALQKLPGVGPKVADCVLLFGYGRLEAFPVDTWIAKLMIEHYPDLDGWSREQIATFARLHFGKAAGLAQQWLFSERNAGSPISFEKFQIKD